MTPFTLLGLVLSIFLSFRNSACYDRWWEGRKLWGQLVYESRSLARQVNLLLADDAGRRRRVAYLTTAFAHALAARLRGRIVALAALPWLDKRQREQLGQRENVPDALLAMIAAELAHALRAGQLEPILYTQLEERLHAMSSIQAGCERILTTPLPFAYTLLLHRCAWMFCVLLPFGLASSLGWGTPVLSAVLAYAFFGLDQLGEEMEDPSALSRTICRWTRWCARSRSTSSMRSANARCPNPAAAGLPVAIATLRSLPCPIRCTARAACATTSSRVA